MTHAELIAQIEGTGEPAPTNTQAPSQDYVPEKRTLSRDELLRTIDEVGAPTPKPFIDTAGINQNEEQFRLNHPILGAAGLAAKELAGRTIETLGFGTDMARKIGEGISPPELRVMDLPSETAAKITPDNVPFTPFKDVASEIPARLGQQVEALPALALQFEVAAAAAGASGLTALATKLTQPIGWLGGQAARLLPAAIRGSKYAEAVASGALEATAKQGVPLAAIGGTQGYVSARQEGKPVGESLGEAATSGAKLALLAPLFGAGEGAMATKGAMEAIQSGEHFATTTDMYDNFVKRGVPENVASKLVNQFQHENVGAPIVRQPAVIEPVGQVQQTSQAPVVAPTETAAEIPGTAPPTPSLSEAVMEAGGINLARSKVVPPVTGTGGFSAVVDAAGRSLEEMHSKMLRAGYDAGATPEDFANRIVQDQAAKEAGFKHENRFYSQGPTLEEKLLAERKYRESSVGLPGEEAPSQAPPQAMAEAASPMDKTIVEEIGKRGWSQGDRLNLDAGDRLAALAKELHENPDEAAVTIMDQLTRGGLSPTDAAVVAENMRKLRNPSAAKVADAIVNESASMAEKAKEIPLRVGDTEYWADDSGNIQSKTNKKRLFNWEAKQLDMNLLAKLSPEAKTVYGFMESVRARVRSLESRLRQELLIDHKSVGKGDAGKRLDSALLADETLGRRLTDEELTASGITGKLRTAYDRLRHGTLTVGGDMQKRGFPTRDPRTHHPDVYKGEWRVFNETEQSMYGRFMSQKDANVAAQDLAKSDPKSKYLVTQSYRLPPEMDTKAMEAGLRKMPLGKRQAYFANVLARKGGFRNYIPNPVEAQYGYETGYWRKAWLDDALKEVTPVLDNLKARGDRVLFNRLQNYVERIAFGHERIGSDLDTFLDKQVGVKGLSKMNDMASYLLVQNSIGGNTHVPLIMGLEAPITSVLNPRIGPRYTARGIAEYESAILGVGKNLEVNKQVLELAGEHNPLRYGSAGKTLKQQLRPTQILTVAFNRAKDWVTGFPMLGRYWRLVEEGKRDPAMFHADLARESLHEGHFVSGNFSGSNMPEWQANRAMRLFFMFKHYPKMVAERTYVAFRSDPKLAAALLTVPPILFGVSRIPFAEQVPGMSELEAKYPRLVGGGAVGALTGLSIGAGHGLANIFPQSISDLSPPTRTVLDFIKSNRGLGDAYEAIGPAGKSLGRIERGFSAMDTGVAKDKRGNVVVKNVTPVEGLGIATGFPPVRVQQQYAVKKADQERQDQLKELQYRAQQLTEQGQPVPRDMQDEIRSLGGSKKFMSNMQKKVYKNQNSAPEDRKRPPGVSKNRWNYIQELRRAGQ